MATLYYRGMASQNNQPRLGRSARLLGVRPSIDIDVEQLPKSWLDENGYLKPEAERGPSDELVPVAIRSTKGMSTSLSIEALPMFRKPVAFGETGKDPLWEIQDSKITGDLEAVQDSPTHVSIMPRTTMLLDRYEATLTSTQQDWQQVKEERYGMDI